MKTLSIVRHAKTERPDAYDHDAQRPLTKRGHKDARRMAEWLARLEPPIDWVISSPAVRTRETMEEFAPELKLTQPVSWEDAAYLATAETLLGLLQKTPQNVEHVMLLGHNPGVTDLVVGLCTGAPRRLHLHMSTGALVHMRVEIFQWDQLRWGCGQLRMVLPPKQIRKLSISTRG